MARPPFCGGRIGVILGSLGKLNRLRNYLSLTRSGGSDIIQERRTSGVSVFRLSLILTLAAMQLLAGSGRAVYLCVSSDGSLCCLDSGPLSCTCCRHENDSTSCEDACCEVATEECESKRCHHDDDQSSPNDSQLPKTEDAPSVASGACSCTHELVSTGQVGSNLRSSMTDQVSDVLQLSYCLSAAAHQQAVVAFDGHACWHGPPPMPDATLAALATVIIRC